jgi:hypothetical protein
VKGVLTKRPVEDALRCAAACGSKECGFPKKVGFSKQGLIAQENQNPMKW